MTYNLIDENKMNESPLGICVWDLYQNSPVVPGKTRDEVLANGCEIANTKGVTSGWIVRISKNKYGEYLAQFWYIFQIDGNWYFKQDKEYKTFSKVYMGGQ